MTDWLTAGARWVQNIALGLWLGGVVGIGAFAAPAAFHTTRSHAAFAGNVPLQNDIAGAIVGQAFRNFNILCIVCGLLMLINGAVIVRGVVDRRARRLHAISAIATLVLLALTVYLQYGLFPVIDAAKLHQQWGLFDQLHHRYVDLTNAQLPLLLVVAWLAALRDTARTLPASSISSN